MPVGEGPNMSGSSRKHRRGLQASLGASTQPSTSTTCTGRTPSTPIEGGLSALDHLISHGKVLYAGVNLPAWRRALEYRRCTGGTNWSQCSRSTTSPTATSRSSCCPPARAGLGVVTSARSRGVLTGKYSRDAEPPPDSRAGRGNVRLLETEYRESSFELAQHVVALAEELGCTAAQLAVAWVMANALVTCPIIGPRTIEQLEDNLGALEVTITPELEERIDCLVPPGEHTGWGYQDPSFPVTGRQPRA